jgi:hypothetical protein
MKIWISYSRHDLPFVNRLKDELQNYGNDVLLIDADFDVGDNILSRINEQIKQADAFLLVFSKSSERSPWFNSEIFMILDEKASKRDGKPLIPIVLNKNVKLPPIVDQIFYSDFSDESRFQNNFKKLLLSLENYQYQDMRQNERTYEAILKEKQQILNLEKKEYELSRARKTELVKFVKFSYLVILSASLIASVYLLSEGLIKGEENMFDDGYVKYIIIYFLGVLTALIPSLYINTKKRKKINGK